jgi:hypothetical protein
MTLLQCKGFNKKVLDFINNINNTLFDILIILRYQKYQHKL